MSDSGNIPTPPMNPSPDPTSEVAPQGADTPSKVGGEQRERKQVKLEQPQAAKGFESTSVLIAILIPIALLAFWFMGGTIFNSGPLPICSNCPSGSALRSTLETLDPLWANAPQSTEELQSELALLETASAGRRSSGYRISERENECLTILAERFDIRLNDYVRTMIEGLVGFGPDEACPRLQTLLALANRLQTLMNHTSKETPKCKELLEWHLLQYSCSARQP